jgi:hypothetical protein
LWGLLLTDLPLRLAFPFHRPALEHLLAEAGQSPQGELHDTRSVGLYPVKGVYPIDGLKRHPSRRCVHLPESSLLPGFDGAGFFYTRSKETPYARGFNYKGNVTWIQPVSLGDGWYAYVLLDND